MAGTAVVTRKRNGEMLYLLSGLSDSFGPLRLFNYVTFRAGGAWLTAFLLVLLLGNTTVRVLKR